MKILCLTPFALILGFSSPLLAQDASHPMPEYDMAAFCGQYGEAGSASCLEGETMAKEHLATLLPTAPAHIGAYCDNLVRETSDVAAGHPSYMVAASCLGAELEGYTALKAHFAGMRSQLDGGHIPVAACDALVEGPAFTTYSALKMCFLD